MIRIELNDILQVLEVPPEVRVGKFGLEGISHPEAKESPSEVRNLHCPTEHVQHPHACGPSPRVHNNKSVQLPYCFYTRHLDGMT